MKKIKLSDLKPHEKNPRKITPKELERLKRSLESFTKMMEVRGIVVNKDNMILGGNQRYRALVELGFVEIPESWVEVFDGSPEEEAEFMFRDNDNVGRFDLDMIEDWTQEQLDEWTGGKVKKVDKEETVRERVEFSEFLGESNNYIVLKFDNDLDWLAARSHFGLKTVTSKRSNGKPWSSGIGRVVNGGEYLKKMKDLN